VPDVPDWIPAAIPDGKTWLRVTPKCYRATVTDTTDLIYLATSDDAAGYAWQRVDARAGRNATALVWMLLMTQAADPDRAIRRSDGGA
jgi:hypothetical protein